MSSRRESLIRLRDGGSDQELKAMARSTKSLNVFINQKDSMNLDFIRLFTDNFVNGNSDCCRFLDRMFETQSEISFQDLCDNLHSMEVEHKNPLAPPTSDSSYMFRFVARNNHVLLVLDVSPYMYRYDYSTKCLSIQNLEEILVLLFRLLLMKKEATNRENRLYVSVYGYSLDCPDLFVIYEFQEVNRESVNELLIEAQSWLRKRFRIAQSSEGNGVVTRISDHIQQVLDRIRIGRVAHRMLILSNFQEMPDSPAIFFPSGWCNFGFVIVGQGNFGTEKIDEERVKEHYPSGEVAKMRHFFTAKFIENCDKTNIIGSSQKFVNLQSTTYKERNLLFMEKGELIEDILQKLMIFELTIELKKPAQRHGQYHKRDVLRQYSLPADKIVKVLKSRYMEGWEPFHSGALALNSKAYCFRLKIDRFTHLVYCAVESDNKYVVKLSMEKHSNSMRYRRILQHSEGNNVVVNQIEELEQIDMLLTSDFSSFKPKSHTISFGNLLEANYSEIEILIKPKFRDIWSIFFPVESVYIGVFKIEAKTEQLFMASLLEFIGRRLEFRVYYKQSSQVSIEEKRTTRKVNKKGVLTLFVRHNRNCVELRMGFPNMPHDEINAHLVALRNKIRLLDLGEAIIREVPEVLFNQQTNPDQVNRIQVEYQIKAGTQLVYKWLEKHIIVWRLKNNFYHMDSGLYVKIKNLIDVNGNKHQFCIYYSIRKGSDFTAHVTVFSCPRFNQVKRANGGLISCKQLILEYGQELKAKEQGLCRLLGTYLWIHRELILHKDIKIIGRMLDKLSSVHSWTPTYSGFESELSLVFEQSVKAYEHLPVTKQTLHALPLPERFLIESDALADVGLNINIAGHIYQAILVAPLIPVILQVRESKTYYRVIRLPQEESQKELQLLDESLHLLQEDIRHKTYLQTYVEKFGRREGGDWMQNMRETSIEIGEFFVFWNTGIECEINCHYFQFRRSHISNVKLSFQRAFMELLGLLFELNGDDFFEKPFTPRSFRQGQTAYISQKFIKLIPRTPATASKTILRPFIVIDGEKILVSRGDLVSGLNASNIKTSYDGNTSVKLVLSYTTLEETGLPASVNFLIGPLQEIFKEFIIDFKRLDPKMLKQEEKCMGMVKSVLPLIDSLNNMKKSEYKFDLIQSKQASSQRNLAELMKTPVLGRMFMFCPVNDQFLFVHLLYLNSKTEEKGFLNFQNRIFEFAEFRKHIAYFIPFWFTLEIKEDTIETKLLIAPFNQTNEHNTKSLQSKIDRYVGQLFELANLNTLVAQLNITNNCPFDPYELYINEATSKMLRQKATLKTPVKPTKKSKMEIRFAARKQPPPKLSIEEGLKQSSSIRHFRLPLLYTESIPLYERFQEGQGLENIAQNQFWNSIEIGNLQDTYKTPFKDDTLVFHFTEIPVSKADPQLLTNIEMFKKCKNLLVYSVYCINSDLHKSEVDGTFRQNIINSQESRLVEKMSEFLMRSSEVLNETELSIIMKGSKASIRIQLPYMSSYGIYLCYLKQSLSNLHLRTSRRLNKQQQARSDSRNNSLVTRNPEFEYGEKEFTGQYEYKYNQNDDTLFLFNFHRNLKSKAYFGECVYLLEVFLSENSGRLDTLCESFSKYQSKTSSRKAKIFVYGIDPKDARHSFELEEITKRISPSYLRPAPIVLTPEPRRNSNRDSTTDDNIVLRSSFREREHRRVFLEFDINIFGDAAYDKIKAYLERTVQVAFEDYLIETVIGKLRKSIRDENENFSLRSRHKKSMDHDDMEPLHEENIESLTNLELWTSSTKSQTIMRCGSNGWDIEHCHLVELFHSLVRQVTNILTGNSLDLPPKYFPRLEMLYYFMNQDRKPVDFGNYWETYSRKNGVESLDGLDDSDTLQGQIGIVLSEHLIDELGEKNEEVNKYFSPWTAKMKKFTDGKFFSNDFNFKRHFLLKLSLNRKGVDLFTYNMDPSVNTKLQLLLHSVELWSLERKNMKDFLMMLNEKKVSSLSKRVSSYVKRVSSLEVLDDFEEKKDLKRPDKGIQLSVTSLMKKLIIDVMPPTDNGLLYMVNQKDMDTIYKIIEDEKIDFEELPEPKRDFKGILHKLGFQAMSIIRKRYLMRGNFKPEQEADQQVIY